MIKPRWSLAAGAILATVLSGCILFPPFFPPMGELEPGELVIENRTDSDWVVDLGGDFPMAFAVAADAVGTVPVFATTEMELVLRDAESCDVVDEVAWDGSAPAVRIEEPGALTVLDAAPAGADRTFVEYWDCVEGVFLQPDPGDRLPDAEGSILVFSPDGAAFALTLADGTLAQLSPDPEAAGSFSLDSYHAWSPDGDRLAFSREEGTEGDGVFVAAADGSQPKLVAPGGRVPRWSPDGTRLAYVVVDPFDAESRLEVVDLATGSVTEVAPDATDASWSPDGTRLAVVSGSLTDPAADRVDLRIVNADGSAERTIGETVPYAPPPAWSPDGARLAFTAPAEGGTFLIGSDTVVMLHEIASGRTEVLAAVDGRSVSEPAWSPDGSTVVIVVQSLLGASGSIAAIEVASGERTELHETPDASYTTPIWSPDGEWLAFTRTTNAGLAGSLVAVPRDGGEETVLATAVLVATQWVAADGP